MTVLVNPELIFAEGEIVSVADNGVFTVVMPNGHRLAAFISGKKQEISIRRLPGEKVLLEISPYDLSRGRIVAGSDQPVNLLESTEVGKSSEQFTEKNEESSRASQSRPSDLTVASGEAIPLGGFVVPGSPGEAIERW